MMYDIDTGANLQIDCGSMFLNDNKLSKGKQLKSLCIRYIDEIRSDRQMLHTEKRMLEPIYGLKSIFSFQEINNYKTTKFL